MSDLEHHIARHAARPDRPRATLGGDYFPGTGYRGIDTGFRQPRDDGTLWWQIGIPEITMGKHPHPVATKT